MNWKSAALLLIAVSIVLAGCTSSNNGSSTPEAKTTAEVHLRALDRNLIVVDKFQEFPKGTNAFSALSQMAQLQISLQANGKKVTGVNELHSTSDRQMGTFVNGEEFTQGIDSLTLNQDITIEFRLPPAATAGAVPGQ
ncbi:MAG: hypothetical protein V1777_01570 [Candidatus Micrarchaeota archaeon]